MSKHLRLQCVSDLHLEFYSNHKLTSILKPSADILCLLGDIHPLCSVKDFVSYTSFIEQAMKHYEHVIIVLGNHEYYNSGTKQSIEQVNNKLIEWCKLQPKVHLLNNTALHINCNNTKYTIIGTTLWSYIPKQSVKNIQETMNDYQHIYASESKKLTVDVVNKMFKRNYAFIQDQITKAKSSKSKLVVLTHHKPYLNANYNIALFDPAYESDCSALFGKPIVAWCYGHTHKKDDTVIKGTRFISNPRGYPYERTLFDKSFVVTI